MGEKVEIRGEDGSRAVWQPVGVAVVGSRRGSIPYPTRLLPLGWVPVPAYHVPPPAYPTSLWGGYLCLEPVAQAGRRCALGGHPKVAP